MTPICQLLSDMVKGGLKLINICSPEAATTSKVCLCSADGSTSPFEKPLEFEYQKEFRFHVERNSTKPFIIKIGSLSDIADIYPSDIVIDTLEIRK